MIKKTLSILAVFAVASLLFVKLTAKADTLIGFNEGHGTTVSDSEGTAVGNITNAVWKSESDCTSGSCLYFDGSGDYVSFGDDANFDFIAATNFTIEFWFRTKDITSGTRVFVSKYRGDDVEGGYKVYMSSDGKVNFGVDDDNTWNPDDIATSINAYDDSYWHHVVAAKTGTTSLTLYVDGTRVARDVVIGAAGTLVNDDALVIGMDSDLTSNAYIGFIDEFKIFTTSARSETQVKTDYQKSSSITGTSTSFGPDNSNLTSSLVGYWKADENTGTTVADYSGNANTGTAGGSPTWAAGKFGSAVSYSSNDYVTVADNATLNFGATDSFTIAAWIRRTGNTAFSNPQAIVDKMNSYSSGYSLLADGNAANQCNLAANTNDGSFCLVISDGTDVYTMWTDNTYTADSVWYHVVAVLDRTSESNSKIYVNGVSEPLSRDGTFSAVGSLTGDTNPTCIGSTSTVTCSTGGLSGFIGQIDETRIYRRALTSAEVTQLYNYAPGPVARWSFDENTGQFAYDDSGNNLTATLGSSSANTTADPSWVFGKYGTAIHIDGTHQYVQAADNTNLDLTQNFTISMWIRPAAVSGTQGLLVKGILDGLASPRNYAIYLIDDELSFSYNTGGWFSFTTSGAAIQANQWTHIAYSRLTGDESFYVNGKLVNTQAPSAALTAGTDALTIGTTYTDDNSENYTGDIDDVRIYKYVRSEQQITQDMNAGHPAPGSPVGSAIGKYHFDEGYGGTAYNSGSAGSAANGDLAFATACPGDTTCPTWTNDGKFGKALVFNGNDNIDFGSMNSGPLYLTERLTFSVWVKLSALNADQVILSRYALGQDSYALGVDSSNHALLEVGGQYATGTTALTTGVWYHLAGTWDLALDGGRITIYVNGKPEGFATQTNGQGTWQTITAGSTNDGLDYLNGTLDELEIYGSALTADQVKSLYNFSSSQVLGSVSTTSTGLPDNSASRSYCVPGDTSTCSAPQGEWKLDEKTGVTANDTSGNSNTGTLTAGPTWVPGVLGSGVNFTAASSQYISLATAIPTTTTAFTISAWVKPVSLASELAIFGGTTGGNFLFNILTSGTLALCNDNGVCGNIASSNTGVIVANKWQHVAVTHNGSGTYAFYVNGVNVTSDATGDFSSTASNRFIGRANIFYFDGQIDQFTVYSYARSQSQVSWDYNRGAPLARYDFDECSGDTLHDNGYKPDRSTSFYPGTITPGASGNTSSGTCGGSTNQMWFHGATGKYNASLDFDGADDYVAIGDQNTLDIGANDSFSVEAWVNRQTFNTFDTILAKTNDISISTGDGYAFYINAGDRLTLILGDGSNGVVLTSNTLIDTAGWNHVVAVYNDVAQRVDMYINGKHDSFAVGGLAGTSPDNALSLTIGAESDGGNPFDGQIDNLRIYKYPLTAAQVKNLYNNSSAISF
jgi:hypothetical protein